MHDDDQGDGVVALPCRSALGENVDRAGLAGTLVARQAQDGARS